MRAFVFPGQGSQKIGMGAELADASQAARDVFGEVDEALSQSLSRLMREGPEDELLKTANGQPAIMANAIATLRVLERDFGVKLAEHGACVAGHSLGEYTALVFAGAMSFEDGLKVVRIRAEAMKEAASVGDHGMLSVIGLDDATLDSIVARAKATVEASRRAEGGTDAREVACRVANYLFPTGRVVSGDADALDEVAKLAAEKNAMKTARLAVSGAFHTERMASAREKLERALAEIEVVAPKIPCYSNVTGRLFDSADPEAIRTALAEQLVSPVRWEDTLRNIVQEKKDIAMYELGPNKQIKSMSKRISNEAWKKFQNVDVA
jgi:[acyl-carrier-protein] S-malonyltransferase